MNGTVSFPTVDPEPLLAYARSLRQAAHGVAGGRDHVAAVASQLGGSSSVWSSGAAESARGQLTERSDSLDAAAITLQLASIALTDYAAAARQCTAAYQQAAVAERAARSNWFEDLFDSAVRNALSRQAEAAEQLEAAADRLVRELQRLLSTLRQNDRLGEPLAGFLRDWAGMITGVAVTSVCTAAVGVGSLGTLAVPGVVACSVAGGAVGRWVDGALDGRTGIQAAGDAIDPADLALDAVTAGRGSQVRGGGAIIVNAAEDVAPQVVRSGDTIVRETATGPVTETYRRYGDNQIWQRIDDDGVSRVTQIDISARYPGLSRGSAERTAQGAAAARGVADDVGGHTVPHRWMNDLGESNLYPQNGNFNVSGWARFENMVDGYTGRGWRVEGRIEHLGGTAGRPDALGINWVAHDPITNRPIDWGSAVLPNRSGTVFDRVPNSQIPTRVPGGD